MINIYVDGSYNIKTKEVGWAYIILHSDNIVNKNSNKLFDKYGSRNVTGELLAVIKSLEKLENLFNAEINIYYDYLGIEMWTTNKWNTNKPLTIWYKNKINELKEKYKWNINFIKVKSHSGNKYNDMVDKLAKNACGIK